MDKFAPTFEHYYGIQISAVFDFWGPPNLEFQKTNFHLLQQNPLKMNLQAKFHENKTK